MPKWADNEIEELQGRLKIKILSSMKKKIWAEKKIKFLQENIEILSGIIHNEDNINLSE
jgi:hypothetical protein